MNETTVDCFPTASLDHSATIDLTIIYQKPTVRLSLKKKKETTVKLPNLEGLSRLVFNDVKQKMINK